MRCFYVLVHGRLNWPSGAPSPDDHPGAKRPLGFFCHRYVLARNEEEARKAAFRQVRQNLDKQTGWLSAGAATLDLQAEEAATAPMHKLLMPDNNGHSFYRDG
jgi:hypothetical protein